MGKVRKLRKKFHLSSKNPESKTSGCFTVTQNDKTVSSNVEANVSITTTSLPQENIFAGIDIQFEDLQKSLNQDDSRSVISTNKREFKKSVMSKKERRLVRQGTFIKKISAIQKLKEEEKITRRQKKLVTRNLKPLTAALHIVEPRKTERKRPPPKKRSIPKLKLRQKNMIDDVASFKKMLQDPTFKVDPSAAVASHIQEKIRQNLENA